MKLRKKALLPAIAMVLAAVIALSGVTYAWFTTGNTANVAGLDVNVQTAKGIQVSLDAKSWRSTINASEIVTAAGNANLSVQYPSAGILPVSTDGTTENGKLKMFLGDYLANGNMKSTRETESNSITTGNFLAFDLYFKSGINQTLTLKTGDLSKVIGAAIDGDATVGTERAVRVAFIAYDGLVELNESGAPKALTTVKNVYIWEPNSTLRAGSTETAPKLSYAGFNSEFGITEGDEGIAEGDLLTSGVVTPVTTVDGDIDVIELQEGISKVRVYIWLEGQDVDCTNDISFGDFSVNLSFAAAG